MREANKKVSKEEAVKEIVCLVDDAFTAPAREQIETVIIDLGAQYQQVKQRISMCITWKRITNKALDTDKGQFTPLTDGQLVHIDEPCVVMFMEALELAQLISLDPKDFTGLESHIHHLTETYPERQIIYLIEGLPKYYSLLRTRMSNLLQDQVYPEKAPKRKARQVNETEWQTMPLKSNVEEALCWMQVFGHVIIMQSPTMAETFQWIRSYTRELGMRLYYKSVFFSCSWWTC